MTKLDLPDQRSALYAALAFGGFVDADETERVTLWAAEHIARLESTIAEVRVRLNQIERDRREPDKVLVGVHSARMALTRLALDETQSEDIR